MAKGFKLYNFEKEGKGVRRSENKSGIVRYFAILFRKFWGICKVSLICSIFVIPAALITASLIYMMTVYELNEFMYVLCFAPCIILGPVITGAIKITRDFSREEPVFIWSDFIKAAKDNFKQSIIVSAINYAVMALLYIAVSFYFAKINGSIFYVAMFGLGMLFTIIFLFMQYYLSLMIVSMNLSLKQLYKNAVIFSIVCLWKNFLTTIILAAVAALIAVMIIFSTAFGALVPIWIVLTFGFLIGFMLYTVAFISYPSIKKFAIDPYYEQHKEETAEAVKNKTEDDEDEELPEYVYENGRLVHRSVIENNEETIFDEDPRLK